MFKIYFMKIHLSASREMLLIGKSQHTIYITVFTSSYSYSSPESTDMETSIYTSNRKITSSQILCKYNNNNKIHIKQIVICLLT